MDSCDATNGIGRTRGASSIQNHASVYREQSSLDYNFIYVIIFNHEKESYSKVKLKEKKKTRF